MLRFRLPRENPKTKRNPPRSSLAQLASFDLFRSMNQARVDNSVDRAFRSFFAPDLLILHDLSLHRLTTQQSADLYELIISRRRVSSFAITSNRAVEE